MKREPIAKRVEHETTPAGRRRQSTEPATGDDSFGSVARVWETHLEYMYDHLQKIVGNFGLYSKQAVSNFHNRVSRLRR